MPRFVRIAQGHDTLALTLAVTGLEGAGFAVLTPGRHLDSILPNTSAALGPVPILVPALQADEAMAWLRAVAMDGIEVLERPEDLPGQGAGTEAGAGGSRGPGWLARQVGRLFLGADTPPEPRRDDDE